MKTRRRNNPSHMAPPTHPHRCDSCGVPVPAGDFEPANPTPCWRRCVDCREHTRDQLGTQMLAACGIEHDPDDPAVQHVLQTATWLARNHPAANHAEAEDVARGRLLGAAVPRQPKRDDDARAWQHVDPRELRRQIGQARREHDAAERPTRCTDGVCGCCGVRTSTAWHGPIAFGVAGGLSGDRPPRWPVCAECWTLLDAAGGNPISERARRRWTAVVLGKPASPPLLSVPAVVVPYARFVAPGTRPTGAPGSDEPWSWISDADRAQLARLAPQHRPTDVLDREARAEAAAARLRAQSAAQTPRSALLIGDDQ